MSLGRTGIHFALPSLYILVKSLITGMPLELTETWLNHCFITSISSTWVVDEKLLTHHHHHHQLWRSKIFWWVFKCIDRSVYAHGCKSSYKEFPKCLEDLTLKYLPEYLISTASQRVAIKDCRTFCSCLLFTCLKLLNWISSSAQNASEDSMSVT